MKKPLLVAVIAAAAAGGYFYTKGPTSTNSDPLLSLIPSDSAVVAIQTEAIDYFDYIHSMGYYHEGLYGFLDDTDLTVDQEFIVAYLDGYLKSTADKKAFKSYLGTSDKTKPVFYTLGMIPVYKIELEDPAAFWNTIDQKEQEVGATHQAGKVEHIDYRRYQLTDKRDGDLGLIIAVDGQIATFTIDIPVLGEQNPLKMALGIEKPQHSLADSTILSDLQKKYGPQHTVYAYFDHQAVIKGLTQPDSNLFAQQLDVLVPNNRNPFIQEIRQPACQSDFAAIGKNWPRTVSFSQYKTNNGQITFNGQLIVESNNQVILDALKSLRGFLPTMGNAQDSIFDIGYGLNVAKLAPAVSTIWNELQQPTYSCELIADIQRNMGTENPAAMLSMGASMLNGVKGMHFTLNDMTLNQETPLERQFDKLDFLVSLSAEEPIMLLQTAQMFIPQLSQLNIQPNGTPVDVSHLVEDQTGIQTPMFARLNDKHLVLYSGDKSAANAESLLKQPLDATGLFQFGLNTSRLLELMVLAAEISGEEVPEEFTNGLINNNSITQASYDVTDQGIVLSYEQQVNTK